MPPRSRNHLLPAACDAPTTSAASSLVSPLAISRQNSRSTSRRSDGFPDDFIADRPLNSCIHPAGLPINTSTFEVLRRPVESTQFTSWTFTERARTAGLLPSMGSVGDPYDNAVIEASVSSTRGRWTPRWAPSCRRGLDGRSVPSTTTMISTPKCWRTRCPLWRWSPTALGTKGSDLRPGVTDDAGGNRTRMWLVMLACASRLRGSIGA